MKKDDLDEEPVRKAQAGDEKAFEGLMKKYLRSILNTAYRYTGERNEAEDIAQEVFIKVWRSIGRFKGSSSFYTWLYRIAVNSCLSYRKRYKHRLTSLDVGVEMNEAYDPGPEPERKEILWRALKGLPDRQRIALVLSRFEGRSYREIAEIMNVSTSSVESLIFRARSTLKKKLIPLHERGEI